MYITCQDEHDKYWCVSRELSKSLQCLYLSIVPFQITSILTVCPTACTVWQQDKHESCILLALCEGSSQGASDMESVSQDDVIKWKHFPRYWPFLWGIHRSPVNSPHKGQWRGALMFSLICIWINGWVNNREAGDLKCYRAHYDVVVMHVMISSKYGFSTSHHMACLHCSKMAMHVINPILLTYLL